MSDDERHRVRAVGSNSFIYTGAAILQRGAAFLLLPLYTHLLTPADYGTLAIVTAINGFLVTFFSLCLHASMTRFYVDYRDEPDALRDFWGTVLLLITLVSVAGCAFMLLAGPWLLGPLLGGVQFWPFVALGVVACVFQPFVATYLGTLQIRGEARRYAWYSFSNFLCTMLITVVLIGFAGWGAEGPLTAALITAVIFTVIALVDLRGQYRLIIRREYARDALAYALPQVPHAVSSQLMVATDRFLINHFAGSATTGIYNVGAMFGLIVDVVGQGLNRAYVPLSMHVLKHRDAEGMAHLRDVGLIFVVSLALLASVLTVFARDAVSLFVAPEFESAHIVVPYLAFAGAMGAAYYVLINVMFYDLKAIRFLPFATFASAVVNVTFNLALIPKFGVVGAGYAALIAQTAMATLVGIVGRRFDPIDWPYFRFAMIYLFCFAVSIGLHHLRLGSWWLDIPGKLMGLVLLMLLLSHWLWGDSLRLPRLACSAALRAVAAMTRRKTS